MLKHQHEVAGLGHNRPPCRLCSCQDQDELIEHVAASLWENRRNGHLDDRPWADAGPYWQGVFRDMADTAVALLTSEE